MPRLPSLTPAQRTEITRRLAAGEGLRALAREYKVGVATISRLAVSEQTEQIRNAAEHKAAAMLEIEALPPSAQYVANTLADDLVSMSKSLAAAGAVGAKTAYRLASLANSEVAKVDDADPLKSIDSLRNVGVLTKLANDSAVIATSLLGAKVKMREGADEGGGHSEIVRRMRQARAAGVRTFLKPGAISMDVEDVEG